MFDAAFWRGLIHRNGVSIAARGNVDFGEIREYLRAYRKKLKSGATKGKNAKLAKLRFAGEKANKKRKKLFKKRVVVRQELLIARRRSSVILDAIYPERERSWTPISQRMASKVEKRVDASQFSFIDHPERALDIIKEIAAAESQCVAARIDFGDAVCTDIAPYLVLAEFWPEMAPVFAGGQMKPDLQRVIEAVGLRDPLRMKLQVSKVRNMWALPRRVRRPTGSSKSKTRELRPQKKEEVAQDFAALLDHWLLKASEKFQLTQSGKAQIAMLISELLDNAERHCDPTRNSDGSWSTAAVMARRRQPDGSYRYQCYMGFLSLGPSIGQNLMTAQGAVGDDVRNYIGLHENAGQSKETLAAVVALQDGITSDPNASQNKRGGKGLQDVLQFVQCLSNSLGGGEDAARLTIVSGHTCIRMHPPYTIGRRLAEGDMRELWFNLDNSPKTRPDQQHAFNLSGNFPGTVIGISFMIDQDHLAKALKDDGRQA